MGYFPAQAVLAFTSKLVPWGAGRDQLYPCRFCNAKIILSPSHNNVANRTITALNFSTSHNNVANRTITALNFSTGNYSSETHDDSERLCFYSSLNSKQKAQVSVYVDTLLEWNQRMNLTAVTERRAVMERHVEDSLALLPVMRNAYSKYCVGAESGKLKAVDVGSGAGLPGVILAIACPDWQVTLLESLEKRCFFLERVIEVSGLSNVRVVRARAEDAGQNLAFREKYDIAMARAVADMRVLVEYCLPLVRVGGLLVAAKGYNPQEEVENAKKAIRLMGAFILQLCSVASEGPHGQRTAVLCLKDRQTPIKYPRQPGLPAKQPL